MALNPDHNGESRLDRKTLAKLHIAAKELGLFDEDYRDLLERVTGVRSARDLDPADLPALQRELRRLGWRGYLLRRGEMPPLKYEDLGERPPEFPNPKQLRMLEVRFKSIRGFAEVSPDTAFRAFLKKRFRVDHPRFLTLEVFEAALTAVKRLERERGVKREYRR
jgi:hypothetical protein